MKISSKSILSPGRAGRDPPTSLSTSLSRRLRNSGSIKGGASPAMFPATAKKRGTFENPEPSSPKVTCIGQVRVKSKKKQAKKLRTLSRRHSTGDVSFRKLQHPHGQDSSPEQRVSGNNNNQKWVHFPVTICDALRAFGSEFSCLFPCRKEEKIAAAEDGGRHGCAVFARWLVAVQDGDGDGRKDIELVVGDDVEEDEDEDQESFKKPRRHVFEDLEIINDRIEGHKDESRVSICVPPKNALLLMRCRSDPLKMEALTSVRSWEPTIGKDLEECEDEENVENLEVGRKKVMILDQDLENMEENEVGLDQEVENMQENEVVQDQEQEIVQQNEVIQDQEHENEAIQDQEHENEAIQDKEQEIMQENEVGLDQEHENLHQNEVGHDQELENLKENGVSQEQELDKLQENEVFQDQDLDKLQENEEVQAQKLENLLKNEVGQDQDQEKIEEDEESLYLGNLFQEIMNQDFEIQENVEEIDSEMEEAHEEDEVSTMVNQFTEIPKTHEEQMANEKLNNGVLERESAKEERQSLPECLLMMMYEPKLSMEVSKETWVCSKDFIKRKSNKRKPPPPPAPVPEMVKSDDGDESKISATTNANENDILRVADSGFRSALPVPARSSCSFPVAPRRSMAAMLGQKLADAMGHEPFVLTRCKSEPMKTAAAKLLPESCVWENRKSKRLSGGGVAAFGVGAAGLGF